MKHSTHRSPAEILMYGRHHHAEGGETTGGSMPSNKPHYARGGHPKRYRHRHADGDEVGTMGVNPVSGYKYPGDPENKRKGGRACHAEGDTVVPYRKGGHPHKRKHHADGGEEDSMDREHHNFGDIVKKGLGYAANALPLLSMFLKDGGQAHRKHRPHHKHRRHHEEGEEVPLKRAMGGAGKVRKGMMNEKGSLT